jgi:hypothetical protein
MDARFATEGDERPAPVTDDGPMNLLRKRWIRVPAGFVAMSLASMLAFHVGQDAAQVFSRTRTRLPNPRRPNPPPRHHSLPLTPPLRNRRPTIPLWSSRS